MDPVAINIANVSTPNGYWDKQNSTSFCAFAMFFFALGLAPCCLPLCREAIFPEERESKFETDKTHQAIFDRSMGMAVPSIMLNSLYPIHL